MLTNEEFIRDFLEEAQGHVEAVEYGLLNTNLGSIEPENINTIFRAVHSLKGSAGFFNLYRIVELSHYMESLLGKIRNSSLVLNNAMLDTLLAANDTLKTMLHDPVASENLDISNHIRDMAVFLPSLDNKASFTVDTNELHLPTANTYARLINDALKQGHSYFCLQIGLYEDLLKKEKNPLELIQSIKTIGNFIDLKASFRESDNLGDIILDYYFTTVLQKDFLNDALDIPEDKIIELPWEEGVITEGLATGEKPRIEALLPDEIGEVAAPIEQSESGTLKNSVERRPNTFTAEDSLRIHVSLLNDLLNLASEMVLGRNRLLRMMEDHRKNITGIEPVLQNIDHITSELQEKVMQTRMQPVANVFNRFPRIMRDMAKRLGKEIDLRLEGSEVELDKSIIEAIGDPLTHLVRNAADHGLETPEQREMLGKSRQGTIIIRAYHEGGYVNIDVIDNGAGIYPDKIKSKALEKGIIQDTDIDFMGDQETYQLLFKPGFSTMDKVTDLSGRGVGMDVVKTNIEQLGGSIEVFSTVSQGSTFRLLLPLTLAIIPSLIVQVGNQKFALPQVNLQEIVRIKPVQLPQKIEFINNAEVLRLRGGLLPLVHLADIIGLPRSYMDEVSGHLNRVIRVLVIKIGSRRLGVVVDDIHGSEEILVKPLSSFIHDCRCYSGVTIMGDGKIALILDPEGIITKANLRFSDSNIEKPQLNSEDVWENTGETQNMLLFKCSGPETLAIDLFMVSRVEEIESSDIERVGDREYINFRQDSLRVIRPEDFLPISKEDISSKRKLYVIIPKLVTYPIGLIAENIEDTLQKRIDLNQENITGKGLVGSSIINNKIVLLLNLYELLAMADPTHYATPKMTQQNKHKILVVEDTPFFQKLERDYFEEAGYHVLTANHGQEAWQILQEEKVDAVISDIHMPLMNGIELVKRIRADKELRDLPVMALTSMTGELQIKEGLDAGFDLYEFKLDKTRLLSRLGSILVKGRGTF